MSAEAAAPEVPAPLGFRDAALAGVGATSRVYRAVHGSSGQVVALKRLHRQLVRSDDAVARLRREFEALSRLRHPALVAVRDVIRWQGDPTVVMDFVPGVDLDARIEQGPLGAAEVDKIARALFEALSVAHGAGIVHRDVKPQNVRLGERDRVHLLDFGSARFDAASQLTQGSAQGTTVGTPEYMAPELFAGSVYDPRVDVYGVGATLFKALTGHPPQAAASLTELAFKRTREPVPPVRTLRPDVPAALAQVIDRCLERAPEDRFASCALALWALDHPQAELSFRQRRRAHPPCLHCATPIDPASAVCPRCGSDHPFAFASGSHHVVVHNVKSPERFVAAVVDAFPERAGRGHLRHLTERIAALAYDSQRVVSFVDEHEAQRLADALDDAGAQSEVVEDQGTSGWRLYGWSLALFVVAIVLVGHVALGAAIGWHHALLLALPTAGALVGERLLAVTRGQQGVLSTGRYPASLQPGLRGGLVLSSAGLLGAGAIAPTAASALTAAGAAGAGVAVAALGFPLLVGGASLAAAAAVAWGAAFGAPRLSRAASPEPPLRDKLARAFSPPRSLSHRRLRAETAVLLTATVLSLVPAELAALDGIRRAVPPLSSLVAPAAPPAPVAQGAPASTAPALSGAPAVESGGGTSPALDSPPASAGPAAPAEGASPAGPVTPVRPWWSYAAALLMGLLGLGVAGQVLRRRRAILTEARGLERELWPRALGDGRRAPRREALDSRADRLRPSDALALLPGPDAFTAEARARAADLAHLLDEASADRLRRGLEALSRGDADPGVRSALARTLVASDPELRLRFELLALEGELEAAAAQAWWDRVGDGRAAEEQA